MKVWHIILIILCMVGSFFIGYHLRSNIAVTARTDTVIKVDTLRELLPVPVKEVVTKYVQVPPDTVIKYQKGDTVFLPIMQKEYVSENYHAWVSGYNAALDSIDVFPKTVYITKKMPARRWGLGVSAGYGVGRLSLSPYIGLGVYYRIW